MSFIRCFGYHCTQRVHFSSLRKQNTQSFLNVAFHSAKRHFSNEKDIKQRMSCVRSIQKITQAIKMVATSKIKQDHSKKDIMDKFSLGLKTFFSNRVQKEKNMNETSNKIQVLSIFSDKGLCGGVNNAVMKKTKTCLKTREMSCVLYTVGTRSESLESQMKELQKISFCEISQNGVSFAIACIIAHRLLQENDSKIVIIYNKFRNIIAYDTVEMELPNLKSTLHALTTGEYTLEPDTIETAKDLYEFYVAICVYDCLLNNCAAEQSSRISAMENASKNASDMLTQLKLKYNTMRQMKTTIELMQIISGANSV